MATPTATPTPTPTASPTPVVSAPATPFPARTATPTATARPRVGAVITKYPALTLSSRGTRVKAFQHLLKAKGARMTANGVFGVRTKTAVSSAQNRYGLKATKTMDLTWAKVLRRLGRAYFASAVKALQVELHRDGRLVSETGYFGHQTLTALRKSHAAQACRSTARPVSTRGRDSSADPQRPAPQNSCTESSCTYGTV